MQGHELVLAEDGSLTEAPDACEIAFGSTPPERVVAELMLLLEGEAPSISLRRANARVRLGLAEDPRPTRAVAAKDEQGFLLSVSRTEVESWVAFFLRFYRDGVAEVDHLDVEAMDHADPEQTISVVLRVPHHRPPLTPAELRLRLG